MNTEPHIVLCMRFTCSITLQTIILGANGRSEERTSPFLKFSKSCSKNILCTVAGRKVIILSCVGGVGGKEDECNDNALLFNGERTSS